MILLTTITKRLEKITGNDKVYKEFDCRYLQKWIRLYPNCFPRYMLNNKYNISFNYLKLRYEIQKNR